MEPQYHRGGNTGGRNYYYCDEDDDFSAEELFNIFFGQGNIIQEKKTNVNFLFLGGTTRTYRRRQQPRSFHFTTNSTQNVCCLLNSLFLF
jgi:hypothetical protein